MSLSLINVGEIIVLNRILLNLLWTSASDILPIFCKDSTLTVCPRINTLWLTCLFRPFTLSGAYNVLRPSMTLLHLTQLWAVFSAWAQVSSGSKSVHGERCWMLASWVCVQSIPNFLCRIFWVTGSCCALHHNSSLLTLICYLIPKIHLRHVLINVCTFLYITVVFLQVSEL